MCGRKTGLTRIQGGTLIRIWEPSEHDDVYLSPLACHTAVFQWKIRGLSGAVYVPPLRNLGHYAIY